MTPSKKLWSLWELLTLDAKAFTTLLHTLFSAEMLARNGSGLIGNTPQEAADEMLPQLRALDLPTSIKTVEHMVVGCTTIEQFHKAITQLSNTVMLELADRKFYAPIQNHGGYFQQEKLFGDAVFNNFPSANNDIYESGCCLALDRPTACVMHLMKVLEAGLKVLAKAVGVAAQNDWGSYIREIDAELTKRIKASGKKTPDEEFYAESATYFDRLKIAYRNPTMHPERSYSAERAEEILLAVKSFMGHLAVRLSE